VILSVAQFESSPEDRAAAGRRNGAELAEKKAKSAPKIVPYGNRRGSRQIVVTLVPFTPQSSERCPNAAGRYQ
jgi:hypothetical protein